MLDFIHTVKYSWMKGIIFATIGILNGGFMIAPIYHGINQSRLDDIPLGLPHFGVIFMAALYLIGCTFYVKRIPERYYPKTFDIYMNSHAIFHTFVFLGAIEFFLVIFYLS